ncbi:hypothetical protein BD779DRAFT_1676362 [Infundibulicybe gibba]|nr:hypothetical protein BD779DRAFT_1676362 [Infundibulicybe gibba]
MADDPHVWCSFAKASNKDAVAALTSCRYVRYPLLVSPGYVITSSHLCYAGPAACNFILVADSAENASSTDVDAVVTGNLFNPGFHFTLLPTTHLDVSEIVPAQQSLAAAGGPRIWLDQEDLSITIDSSTALPSGAHCDIRTTDDHSQAWSCSGADGGEWARVYSETPDLVGRRAVRVSVYNCVTNV